MVEKTVTVQNVSGLDMQTAAMIAENSSRFQADIYLQQGSMRANAKSVMGVMMLAAERGAEVTVEPDGVDEQEALDALTELLARNFEAQL